ncbi:SanA/YdcF family protein [Mangrovihabitans endophyticus]|uniref:SanA/YdcF family protein n=1 Tax=Mangrovihabitans endophyticus TaxID=1751298 RepID=UPI001E56E519|nr:ElyC/SanA/YdcF family protein [Mangrovihabitans endophyticus]
MISWIRRLTVAGALATAAAVLMMAAGAIWERAESAGHVYAPEQVPDAAVALVLGAQVDYPGARPSAFLAARLDIARRLLARGAVRAVLVSGDHARWAYDEPGAMTRWLIEHGVSPSLIVQDYAGFDTYDSCQRARRIFGVRRAIVVTQSYHVDRAVALCRNAGIDTDGVGDDTARAYPRQWLASAVREPPAGVKALYDTLSGRDPVLLGPNETGVADALRTAARRG